jgi:O-antigen/teichoic acid export membrane protein
MRQLLKSTSFNLIATVVGLITGIATSIIAARILGPSDLGLFSFITWIFASVVLLVDPGATSATTRFVAELEGASSRAVGNGLNLLLLGIQVLVSCVSGALLFAFSPWIAEALGQPTAQPYVAILGPVVPIAMIGAIFRARLAGFQRYDLTSLVVIVGSTLTLIGTIALLSLGYGVSGLVWLGIGVVTLQLALLTILVLKRYGFSNSAQVSRSLVTRVLRYCSGVFIITSIDVIVWQRSGTLFLGRYSTTEQIAFYGLAFNIAALLVTTLPATLSSILLPAFSNLFGGGGRDSMQRMFERSVRYVGLVAIPICLVTIALADPLISLLYGERYAPAVGALQVLLVASTMGAISGPVSALLFALGKPLRAVAWGFPIAILNLGIAFTLVPSYGALGAAAANAVCQILWVAASAAYLARSQSFELPVASLLRTGAAAGVSAWLAYLASQGLPDLLGLLVGAGVAIVVYTPLVIVMGAINSSDFALTRELADFMPRPIGTTFNWIAGMAESASLRLSTIARRN